MKFKLTILAAAAALFIGLSGPVQAASDTVFFRKSNGWDIYSTKVGCVAGQPFTNDTILYFAMRTDGRGRISILNKRWEIPTAKYPVTLSVDRLPPVTFVGEAEGSMVSVWWKLTPDEINIVSNGAVLRATVGQEIYEYNLAGSRGMLRVVAECTDELMRSANPFASTAPQASTPPTNPFPETASNPYRRM